MQSTGRFRSKAEELLRLPDAVSQLGISTPTIKQWIYKNKIRSIKTAGGHHRIPQSEVDRLLFKTRSKTTGEQDNLGLSERNQLVGRIESVRISGLMAEIVISIGSQKITSVITAGSAREMRLKPGQTAAALVNSTDVMILRV
jgi:molybdopterin-binding protein